MSEPETTIALRSRPDLMGMVPYLLGFHPEQSIVGLLVAADRRVRAAGRLDLAAPTAVTVAQLATVATRNALPR